MSVVKPVFVNESRYDELARNHHFPLVQAFRTELELPDINDYLIFSEENGDLRDPGGVQKEIVIQRLRPGDRGYYIDLNDPFLFEMRLRQEYDMLLDSYDVSAPDYSTDSLRLSRIPDSRNTLYWNPSVRTDSGGEAAVELWTSDETGEYLVITECITTDGWRGRKVIPFRVVKNL